jgi:hypothetical protein
MPSSRRRFRHLIESTHPLASYLTPSLILLLHFKLCPRRIIHGLNVGATACDVGRNLTRRYHYPATKRSHFSAQVPNTDAINHFFPHRTIPSHSSDRIESRNSSDRIESRNSSDRIESRKHLSSRRTTSRRNFRLTLSKSYRPISSC